MTVLHDRPVATAPIPRTPRAILAALPENKREGFVQELLTSEDYEEVIVAWWGYAEGLRDPKVAERRRRALERKAAAVA
ncbi:hypothetical protein ACFW1A_14795 [Kitasatospora sp. NPDC058965]|uniref:hypothetical protein n=1 Tax=Kitasatospora sp. NPDC058965 TaxID=3346682 RepID=UPI0036ACE271